MCTFEIGTYAINLTDLKSEVLLTKETKKQPQKREETLVAGKHFLSQDCKLYRLFNKRKTCSEIHLSFVQLCPKSSFCRTWLGLMFVLVDLLFCGKVKKYT